MALDWKDCITFKTKDDKGKVAIPRASILSVCTKTEKEYSTPVRDIEVTYLFIKIETAALLGVNVERCDRSAIGVQFAVGTPYEIVMGIMRGDKAVEVLF